MKLKYFASKDRLSLIRAYTAADSNILSFQQKNKLDTLCNNIKWHKGTESIAPHWNEPGAKQVIEEAEEETLRLIKRYEKYNKEKPTFAFQQHFKDWYWSNQISAYKNILTSEFFMYQKIILALVILVSSIVCAMIGLTLGIVIGAAVGSGVGSILPALGTAFGGIVGGGLGGMVGAIKGLGAGVVLGAAIGFAILGVIGIVAGWFIGRAVLSKKPSGFNSKNLAYNMSAFADTLMNNCVSNQSVRSRPDEAPLPIFRVPMVYGKSP